MAAHKATHVALRQGSDELLHGGRTRPMTREAVEELIEVRHEIQHFQVDHLHAPRDPRCVALREVNDHHVRLGLFTRDRRRQRRRRLGVA